MVTLIRTIDVWLLYAMVIPATLFPITYWIRSNWRQTPGGISVMLSAIALALLIDVSVAGRFIRVDNPLLSAIVSMIIFLLILVASTTQLIVLLRTQCRAREKDGS